MYSLGCNLCNAFCCCFSYHALLEMHYINKWHKMAATKKWAQEEAISVQEAECLLDSKLFLDEYPRWKADGPPMSLHPCRGCSYMLKWGNGKNANDPFVRAIRCQSLGQMLRWKFLPFQMVGFRTTREEIQEFYNEVYQLKRLLGPPP